MNSYAPSDPGNVVIVTTAARLAGLIDEAVERAVRRSIRELQPPHPSTGAWLTSREAEKAYGRSRSTLHRWRKTNKVRSRQIGGSIYFEPPGHGVGDRHIPPTCA